MKPEPSTTDLEIECLRTAGEGIKALGARNVCLGISMQNRSMEPWCMEVVSTSIAMPHGPFAFSPLHQRPSSPMGMLGVEVGHVYVGYRCPGMFQGFFHPDGFGKVCDWLEDNAHLITRFLRDEMGRTQEEIAEFDFQRAPGTRELSAEEKGVVLQHVEKYLEDLKEWCRKIAEADFGAQDPR